MSDRKDPMTDAEKDAEAKAAEAKAAELKANELRAADMTKAAAAKREKWARTHTKGTTDADLLAADTWPKIFGNINVPPAIVYGPEEAEQLGTAWVEVDLAGYGYVLTPAP
jgi:hypothetical protein